MKSILFENLPCWFELDWRPGTKEDPPVILFRIHEDFVKSQPEIKANRLDVVGLQEALKLGDFQGPLGSERFGFNPWPMIRENQNGGFIQYRLVIPDIERPTGRKCPECKGKGEKYGSQCFYCFGRGQERQLSWEKARTACAVVALFNWETSYKEVETSASRFQLMELVSGVHDGSCPLGGRYSISFVNWLSRYPQHTEFEDASAAMKKAYGYMFGDNRESMLWRTEVKLIHPQYVVLDCPGDACGLHMSEHGIKPGESAGFNDHNLDSPDQQLTLLSGLAALHSRARKEGA